MDKLKDMDRALARQGTELLHAYQGKSKMKLTSSYCEQTGRMCLCLHGYNSEWNPDYYDARLMLNSDDNDVDSPDKDMVIFLIEYEDDALNISLSNTCNSQRHGHKLSLELKIDSPRVAFYIKRLKVITRGQCYTFSEHISVWCTCSRSEISTLNNPMPDNHLYLEYTDELSPTDIQFQQKSRTYRKFIMECDVENSNREAHRIKHSPKLSKSFKAFFIGYHSIVLTHFGLYEDAISWLEEALELTGSSNRHINCLLVRGRTYRLKCKALRSSGKYDEARNCILQSLDCFSNALPSCEVGTTYIEFAVLTLLQNLKGSSRSIPSPQACMQDDATVNNLITKAKDNVLNCKDIDRRKYMISMISTEEALFRLHVFEKLTADHGRTKLPPISTYELSEIKKLLDKSQSQPQLNSKSGNAYAVRVKVAFAHFHLYNGNRKTAVDVLVEAQEILKNSNGTDEHNFQINAKIRFFSETQNIC